MHSELLSFWALLLRQRKLNCVSTATCPASSTKMSYFWPADEDFFSPFNDNEQISVKSEYDDCPFSFADDPSVYGFDPKKERESPAVEGFSQPVAESPQPVAVLVRTSLTLSIFNEGLRADRINMILKILC